MRGPQWSTPPLPPKREPELEDKGFFVTLVLVALAALTFYLAS